MKLLNPKNWQPPKKHPPVQKTQCIKRRRLEEKVQKKGHCVRERREEGKGAERKNRRKWQEERRSKGDEEGPRHVGDEDKRRKEQWKTSLEDKKRGTM